MSSPATAQSSSVESRVAPLTLALWVALTLCGCADPAATPALDPVEVAAEQALLKSLATTVIVPAIQTFATKTRALNDAVSTWCTAVGGQAAATKSRAAAQDAWLEAAQAWQRLMPMAVGPNADVDLAESIYSWPLVNACAVDQAVSAMAAKGSVDIPAALPNRKGLDALETLLFRVSLETTCPSQAAPKDWKSRTPAARAAARCAYASQVAETLLIQANSLEDAWTKGDTPYADILANAGSTAGNNDNAAGSAATDHDWASSHAALNGLSDAIMGLETAVKERRLGAPLGLAANPCGSVAVPCSKALESPWARRGTELLRAHLDGARALLLGEPAGSDAGGSNAGGGDGRRGFDDWLIRKGAGPSAAELRTRLDDARDALAALPSPLHDALTKQTTKVTAAYEAMGKLTAYLKSQLLVALALEMPSSVAGDAD